MHRQTSNINFLFVDRMSEQPEVDYGGSQADKAPGISEGGSEPGDPRQVIVAPELLDKLAKDIGAAGSPVVGSMVSTPTAGGGKRRREVSRSGRTGYN